MKIGQTTGREKLAGLAVAAVILTAAFGLYVALSVHQVVTATRVLLTNGKTASAVSAHKTEVLAQEIKALIESGKTSGAQASKAAAANAAQGLVILHQAEALIGSEILANRSQGTGNRSLLCSLAAAIHDTAAVVTRYCS